MAGRSGTDLYGINLGVNALGFQYDPELLKKIRHGLVSSELDMGRLYRRWGRRQRALISISIPACVPKYSSPIIFVRSENVLQ